MSKKTPWYVEARAQMLAVLLLTDLADLSIKKPEGPDPGLDLVAEILKDGRATKRLLGIQLKGTASPVSEKEAARALAGGAAEVRGFAFPVCGFLFDVRQNMGFYTWLNEPVLSEDGQPRLAQAKPIEALLLDQEAVESIIERVNRWYDALLMLLKHPAVRPAARRSS